jgi:cysteinyl-tRNA synthetase
MKKGYTAQEVRFFLMYGHYRKRLNYSDRAMHAAAERLRDFRERIRAVRKKARNAGSEETAHSRELRTAFVVGMDNDLDIKKAFDGMRQILKKIRIADLKPSAAAGIQEALKKADDVLQVLF